MSVQPRRSADPFRGAVVAIAVLVLGACEAAPAAPPAAVASAGATPTHVPTATATPRAPTLPPPTGPDALRCTERVAIPTIPDVIGVTWSPDGRTLAIDHVVALPSDTITGSPEEFFLDALDLASGEVRPLGIGERQQWSGSGKYLSYWSWNGELRIVIGGLVIAAIPVATLPDARWVGDTLYYFAKGELQTWTAPGVIQTIARLPADLDLTYPADDAAWSADAERFTVTRYSLDGTVRRYLGSTRTGAILPLDLPDATYTEWSPRGATLLVRYPDRLELRDDTIRSAPLSRFPGPVHQWTPDGRGLLLGAVTPTVTGGIDFDTFTLWGDGPATSATLPDLIGVRGFSPDGRYFTGDSRTSLRETRLELFRCGSGRAAAPIASAAPPSGDLRNLRPVVGAITQVLTPRHTGIDIAAPLGALIVAADDGVVTAVGWVNVGGRRVCVGQASGVESCAYHTSAALVRIGDHVRRGQPIALVGLTGVTTGPHVHWEATIGTRIIDPLTR